jgi:hypothetical protein
MVSERGWKGGGGLEHRFSISLWDARDGVAAAKDVLADVERVVLAMPRTFADVRLISLRLARAFVKRSPKSWTQGVVEFRAMSVMED